MREKRTSHRLTQMNTDKRLKSSNRWKLRKTFNQAKELKNKKDNQPQTDIDEHRQKAKKQ